MKARNLLMVLLLLCFSCGKKTISDSEKEKIQKEVKEQIQATVKALESADAETIKKTLLDSPDFRYAGSSGTMADYKSSCGFVEGFLGSLINQKGEITNEKIWVLDKSTVLYVAQTKWTMKFKDGRVIEQNPWIWENLLKKIDGKWLSIYGSEFGKEKLISNPEKQKGMNQVELFKQLIGKWKIEAGKDTICYCDFKPYGTGLDGNFQFVANGKIFTEGKQILGYDSATDQFIMSDIIKGMDMQIFAASFITKTKYQAVKFQDMAYPDNAKLRVEVEFKSSDSFEQSYIFNNKVTKTIKGQRIK